ncbi:FecR family protein [Parapedobacter sp. DT-150]|uniref:FecR family protein n=1 Tax=Parapedobacter sp. DT-150 TaxID=3396162 RepID=UPI003F1B89C5
MNQEDFIRSLSRRLTDGLPAAEEQKFREMLAANAAYRRQADVLTRYFRTASRPSMANRIKLTNIWDTIEAADAPAITADTLSGRPVAGTKPVRWRRVAAAVFLCCSIGWAVYQYTDRSARPAWAEIATANEKQWVTLDDGTTVVLNHASSIRYNGDFGADKREIILKGEAYFEVAKNERVPLVVRAGQLRVAVKGTTFHVHAYEGTPRASVSLIEGVVEVTTTDGSGKKMLLKPLQKLEVGWDTQRQSHIRLLSLPMDSLLAEVKWSRDLDSLVFRKQKLKDLVVQMEEKYAVKIEIRKEALKDKRFSGTFDDVDLKQVLEALRLSYPFQYRMEGDKLVIIE